LNRTEQNLGLSGVGSVANQFEDMDNLLKTANFSATMLLNLINDLLDLAKMENSSFNLNASYFNLE
jgi:signal transduction histidine kinase